jgi:hypothetical protein
MWRDADASIARARGRSVVQQPPQGLEIAGDDGIYCAFEPRDQRTSIRDCDSLLDSLGETAYFLYSKTV